MLAWTNWLRKTILVLGVKVPFCSGGAEVLVRTLIQELKSRGHTVDSVELPFSLPTRSDLLHEAAMWRNVHLSRFAGLDVDLVIATKFPSYYAQHPKKSLRLRRLGRNRATATRHYSLAKKPLELRRHSRTSVRRTRRGVDGTIEE